MAPFYYDETSPSCLRWASARANMKARDVAGSLKPDGYWKVRDGATRHQKTLPTLAQADAWVSSKREEVHGEFTKHS